MYNKKVMFDKFWAWYNKHLTLNISVAAGLFVLQLIHLTWLTLHVVLYRLTGTSFWDPSPFWQNIIIVVDYTEIPALFGTSLIYINEIRQNGFRIKPTWYLFALNIQFLHIFWITDEFVAQTFIPSVHGQPVLTLPAWLAWIAILIDYLELPVIFETLYKAFQSAGKGKFLKFLKEDLK